MYGHDTTKEYRAPDGTRLHPKQVEKQQILEELLSPLDPNEDSARQFYRRIMRAAAYFVREHY